MKLTKVLALIFGILTICGAVYVFYTGGRANAGYAVVPAIFCLLFSQRHKQTKWKSPLKMLEKWFAS